MLGVTSNGHFFYGIIYTHPDRIISSGVVQKFFQITGVLRGYTSLSVMISNDRTFFENDDRLFILTTWD